MLIIVPQFEMHRPRDVGPKRVSDADPHTWHNVSEHQVLRLSPRATIEQSAENQEKSNHQTKHRGLN
jgi:hypothetical protein